MDQIDLDKAKVSFSSVIEGVKGGKFDAEKLEALLQDYPYCQPLYVLKAASEKESGAEFEKHLSRAALYSPEREVLYRVVHKKLTFNPDFERKIAAPADHVEAEPAMETIQDASITRAETSEPAVVVDELSAPEKETELETVIPDQELPVLEVNQEEEAVEEVAVEEVKSEKPIFDNIATSDYFTFNKSTADPLARTEELEEALTVEEIETDEEPLVISAQEEIKEDVAKYDDDQMPYTFLWWLHKTRKEHAHTYQPYATYRFAGDAGIKKKPVDELNHQIIESIFHLQVPLKDESQKPASSDAGLGQRSHGVDLIEKFIKEEPQIRPPKAEKIDTENKARKSSEDNFDLVSETLAHIYIEQMLYHKAIDTYKKLSLKFPEKSTYFAAQIIELQKKIS